METLIVKVKDKNEMKLVSDILAKLHISSTTLSDEESEDLGLSKMLKEVNRSEKVSREAVMKKLKG